ncbi:MAG: hypothetical protein R3B82_04030 [Sandaracinaceae bacterium]
MNRLALALALALLGAGIGTTASAQSLEDEQAAMGDDGGGDDGGAAGETGDPGGEAATEEDEDLAAEQAEMEETPERLGDEQAEMADEEVREQYRDSTDPHEDDDTDYFFLGAFGRAVVIPGFIQTLFVDGGIDGFNPGTGLTFNWRRNNFNIVANLWWNNAQGDGFFRASGDPRTDTEYIEVNLGVIFINAEFLWSFPVTDWFAIEAGFDLGFGFIYGELIRTEATESSPGSGDWSACTGPGGGTAGYCEPQAPDPCYDRNGGHYNCVEPNWFTDGGDTPFIFPWVGVPHLAVRFKPLHQVQIRIDGGWGLYSFYWGGSVSYGF